MQFFSNKLKFYFSNIWFLWAGCLILNIITFFLLYLKIHPGPQTLALKYNILVGVQWYGKGINLYFIPGVGLIITWVNFMLYRRLEKNQNFLPALTIFASYSVQIILLMAVIFLTKVN